MMDDECDDDSDFDVSEAWGAARGGGAGAAGGRMTP